MCLVLIWIACEVPSKDIFQFEMASLVDVLGFNECLKSLNDENTIRVCQKFQELFGNQTFKQSLFFGACQIVNHRDIDKESFVNFTQTVRYVLYVA